jgi:hypothetical protein
MFNNNNLLFIDANSFYNGIRMMVNEDKKSEMGGVDSGYSFRDSSAEVRFEEYQTPRAFYPAAVKRSKMTQWVIKYSGGLVKDENQANYILIGFIVLIISVSLFLLVRVFRSPTPPPADRIIEVAGPQGE